MDPESRGTLGAERWFLWIALPAVASVMLLASTNHISQNVAVIPFLWVAPLTLYLVSFIITFDNDRWYDRRVWYPVLLVALGVLTYEVRVGFVDEIVTEVALYVGAMFACCMVCHGELVRLRPHASRLTAFYLMVALGGVVGGLLVSVVVPRVFGGFWELYVGLLATLGLATWCVLRGVTPARTPWRVAAAVCLPRCCCPRCPGPTWGPLMITTTRPSMRSAISTGCCAFASTWTKVK